MTGSRTAAKDRHARLAGMRIQRNHLPDADVEPAIEEVDSSGLVPLLEEFAHLPRGRHRRLRLRTLLVGLHLCCQITGGKIVLERTTDLLYFRLSPAVRAQLDIPEYVVAHQRDLFESDTNTPRSIHLSRRVRIVVAEHVVSAIAS